MAAAWELDGMRRAIVLSAFGLGTTSPNPPVGCVVFDATGRRVGEGYHERKGEAHAETRALAVAGAAADGGTAVVTLEPCNHFGRTPPCRKALIDAGIARVLIAVLDPTSRGDGGAVELQKAGIRVEVGVCEEEARLVLGPWLAALHVGRPTVTWAYQVHLDPEDARGSNVSGPDGFDIDQLGAGRDVVVYGDGRTVEGRPGGHGSGVFALPAGPLAADPHAALADLAAAGARTVLLAGGRDLAEPYLAAGLVDDIAVHLVGAPTAWSSGAPAHPGHDLPTGFRIAQVVKTVNGLRVIASTTAGSQPDARW
jgi:diaminohydroxyphosphoribosylaminopyrimidine deaminase/5-amino-6-(5-phosphoribosylamino)uracil reductase